MVNPLSWKKGTFSSFLKMVIMCVVLSQGKYLQDHL